MVGIYETKKINLAQFGFYFEITPPPPFKLSVKYKYLDF